MKRLVASLGLLLVASCSGTPPRNPATESVTWRSYHNPQAGYTIQIPNNYAVQERGVDTLFRFDGYPVLAVNWADEASARHRGLWPGHEPAGVTEVGGVEGSRYVYSHYDGPSSMRTVSHVVKHGGRYLAVEFRTDLDEPDGVQQHILDSLRFD